MYRMNKKHLGFTFTELFIVLSVLVILAAIAWPAYQNFQRRTYFDEIIKAITPLKESVSACYQDTHNFINCNGGGKHIPANLTMGKEYIASVKIKNGIISVNPIPKNGILISDDYILMPKANKKDITWVAVGNAVTKGYAE